MPGTCYTPGMAEKMEYLAELTTLELDALDRGRTICVLALSPLEVHGPHLPLGTDVFVAEEVRDRAIEKLKAAHPEYGYLYLPSYYLGSDTIPGSVAFDSRAVNLTLRGLGEFLASRGFRYLLVFDNHGGPRHQIAIAKAANRLYRKDSFLLIAPFLSFYRRMVENDPALLESIQAGPGACGDIDDCHAGLNETSLMLASRPEEVRTGWDRLERTGIRKGRWPAVLLGALAKLAAAVKAEELAGDITLVGTMLSWTTEKCPPTYIGEPREASPQAGERMLDAFAEEALTCFEACLAGAPPPAHPLGWSLRFLEPSR